MSDPNRCAGMDDDSGQQCICRRVEETYVDDNGRTLCKSCRHIASAHPSSKPNITSFVKSFVDKAKQDTSKAGSSSTTKASQEEAAAETSAGLRGQKKRKSDSSEAGPSSKKANKGTKVKTEKAAGKDVKYGKAVLVVCGLRPDGTLRNPVTPSREDINGKLKLHQLAVYASTTSQLYVNTGWTHEEAHAAVCRLFPEALAFLQKMHPTETNLWRVASSYKNHLTLDPVMSPTGLELANSCSVPGRSAAERVIFIATTYKIASHHWDWALSESSDLGSDIDTLPSEDIVHAVPKPRPAYKGKGKGKAVEVKTEPVDDSADEEESDMKQAAKLRMTRLASVAITRKPLFIEEPEVLIVDDEEEDEDNEDPPSFFDDFVLQSPTETPSQPSTSSVPASSSTSAFTATFSSWAPPSTWAPPAPVVPSTAPPAFNVLPAPSTPELDYGGESSSYAAPAPRFPPPVVNHRFKRMGKGRGN
ncbi:hypothetical protein R3P38DRAFT_2587356 [Favolaschia claudopus]|uniref:Uncharacterized protein n=1 Tax=Favolaschia claudopus TaxID=2862362 RepID=A0AAV9Z4V7_9AGAR